MLVEETTMAYKEPMLFGYPKYKVESAARTLREARELEKVEPGLYAAGLKQLKREQTAIGDVLRAARKSKRTSV